MKGKIIMSGLYRTIKQNSKLAMKGNWGKATAIVLILTGIALFFRTIEYIIALAANIPTFLDVAGTSLNFLDDQINIQIPSIILTASITLLTFLTLIPLGVGLCRWFYLIAEGKKPEVLDLFYFFSSVKLFFRSIWLAVQIGVCMLLWTVLFLLPSSALITIGSISLHRNAVGTGRLLAYGSIVLGTIIAFFAAVMLLAVSNRYLLAPYLIGGESKLSAYRAVKTSIRYMHGSCFSMLWFQISFVLWFALCIFVLPALYVLPYFCSAQAIYAKYLIVSGGREYDLGRGDEWVDMTQEFNQEDRQASNYSESEFEDITREFDTGELEASLEQFPPATE